MRLIASANLGPRAPCVQISGGRRISSLLVQGTGMPERMCVRRGVRHSLGQPGAGAPRPREAPADATTGSTSPRCWPFPLRAEVRRLLRPRSPSYGVVFHHAAVRGPGERRRENGGRDRSRRGLYQVSGRGAGCGRPEGGRVAETQASSQVRRASVSIPPPPSQYLLK